MKLGRQKYYCSIYYLLSRMVLAAIPIAAVFITVYLFYTGYSLLDPCIWPIITTGFKIGLPILFISILIYVRLFPVTLKEEGIIGHNARGQKQRLTWPEIVYAGPLRNGGFPCHKLQSSASGRYVLIPNFLRHFDQLAAELKAHGLDLSAPPLQPQSAPADARPRRQMKRAVEPRREGSYIVITTERSK